MIKKYLYALVIFLLFTACSDNKELVSYELNGKSQKVVLKQLSEDLRSLYGQVPSGEFKDAVSSLDVLKMIVYGRLIESVLLTEEALKISNFLEDPNYQEQLKNQEKILVYQTAFQNGQTKISDEIKKQSIEVAEISRIIFTNGSPLFEGKEFEGISMVSLLETLIASEDIINDFSIMAEKYSQEDLASSGGYLGLIQKGQFAIIDDIVFKNKHEGIYTEIISNENEAYIILVHTKAKKIKVSDIEKEGLNIDLRDVEYNYINDNVKILFKVNSEISNLVYTINGKEIAENDLNKNLNVLQIWGKKYSIEKLTGVISILLGEPGNSSPQSIMKLLASDDSMNITPQLATIFKGYNNNIVNSKEYKKQVSDNAKSLKLENVYQIISAEVFKDVSSEVTEAQLQEFYNNPANRIVTSFTDDGTPIFASLTESQEKLKQSILRQRSMEVEEKFREKFREKSQSEYEISWNEDNLTFASEQIIKDFEQYMKKNPEAATSFGNQFQ